MAQLSSQIRASQLAVTGCPPTYGKWFVSDFKEVIGVCTNAACD